MQKKVKNLYLRKGEHSFVLQSQFIFKAKQQKWTSEDIQKIIEKTDPSQNNGQYFPLKIT